MIIQKIPKNLRYSLFSILGSIVAAISYTTDISINIEIINVRPIHVIIWIIWFLSVESLLTKNLEFKNSFIFLSIGASSGVIIGYMVSGGLFLTSVSVIPYILLAGLCLSFIAIIENIYVSSYLQAKKKIMEFPIKLWSIIAVSLVLIMRLVNILTRDIPNEGRSLMVAGMEVHHFILGFFIIILSQMLLYLKLSKTNYIIFSSILVAGIAMISDQLSYVVMYPLSDDAYFTFFSYIGAFIGTSWFIFRIYFMGNRLSDEL